MTKLVVNNDRPALEIVRGLETTRWEYDVIMLQLEFERLETLHGLHVDKKLKPPTYEFLCDVAAMLVVHGLDGCSVDTAMRVYSLVKVQWRQMFRAIANQVASLS